MCTKRLNIKLPRAKFILIHWQRGCNYEKKSCLVLNLNLRSSRRRRRECNLKGTSFVTDFLFLHFLGYENFTDGFLERF